MIFQKTVNIYTEKTSARKQLWAHSSSIDEDLFKTLADVVGLTRRELDVTAAEILFTTAIEAFRNPHPIYRSFSVHLNPILPVGCGQLG